MSVVDVKVKSIYTPYHLTDFQKCPRLWDYKQRWQTRDEGNRTALLVGSAVALGLEAHYLGDGRDPVEVATRYVQENYQEGSDRSEEGVLTLVRRGIKHAMATNLGLSEILGVEKFYGRVKPDLVGRDTAGHLVVVDHKVKMSLDDRYQENELLGFDVSNQMWHYAWAIQQEYGEPVEEVMIHLIVLAPRAYTELHPIRITQDGLTQWLESAVKDWWDMAHGENRARYGSCLGKYGPCEFWKACHVLYGDEEKFEVLYERKPERKG